MHFSYWLKFKALIRTARGTRDFQDHVSEISFTGRKDPQRYSISFGEPVPVEPYKFHATLWPEDPWEMAEYPAGTIILGPDGFLNSVKRVDANRWNPERLYGWIMAYDQLSIHAQEGAIRIARAPKTTASFQFLLERGEPTAEVVGYQAFLQSDLWAEIKAAVKTRSGGQCEVCKLAGVDRLSDAVHHLRYPKNPGEEVLEQLLDVCTPHHRQLNGLEGDEGATITFIKS